MSANAIQKPKAAGHAKSRYAVLSLLTGLFLLTCNPPPTLPTQPPTPRTKPAAPTDKPLFRIGFGSCNFQFREQPHWGPILAKQPRLWIWGGDAVYADTFNSKRLKGEYDLQLANKGYQKLQAATNIIGVWDDHDYGFNDIGANYPHKVQSQVHYLDFVGEPKDSPRRKQKGIYTSYTYKVEDATLRIILLDVRYHRGTHGEDILGQTQWQWFEKVLAKSKAAVHLIVSPTQVLRDDPNKETWALYPQSRQRLFSLLRQHKTPGVILLTGDIHVGEISRSHQTGVSYPIYEFTSSGLTHTRPDYALENAHRLVLFRETNFGIIDFYKDLKGLVISLQLYSTQGALLTRRSVPLSSLQPKY